MGRKIMGVWIVVVLMGFALIPASWARENSLAGSWDVTVRFADTGAAGEMVLEETDGLISGRSSPLDEAQLIPLTIEGRREAEGAQLVFAFRGDTVGTVQLAQGAETLSGTGTLYGVAVRLDARRPVETAPTPRTHRHRPQRFYISYGADREPALRLRPGDRVQTETLDNEGRDKTLTWRGMPGNPLTGPFVMDGAMPGDTLVVHLERVRTNRDTGFMYGKQLNLKAVEPGHAQTPTDDHDRVWILDAARGVARPRQPGPKLDDLERPLRPMIGSIGVAAPLNQALYAGDLGYHGGNLDYNRLVEGTTLYLPVYRAGAFLYLGDGHALQGDGEISGQGVETSLDVTFRVDLIKDDPFGRIWFEDETDVMVSGIQNTLDSSLQMATSGMALWLKQRHGLSDSEVATLMSASIRYDIAEVVDPRPHVVARLPKSLLKTLK